MRITLPRTALAASLAGFMTVATAQDTAVPAPVAPPPVAAPASAAEALPAMNFAASLASEEMFEAVKGNALFAKLEKELWGSPVTLVITHSLQPTAGGKAAGLMSAIWSGSTLGLLPMVTSNSFVVRYDVRVQGRDIATYTYQRTFTRAVNIWAQDKTYGLGEDGLAWLKSTAQQFAGDLASDTKMADLKREYEFYFGTAPTT